MSVFFKVAVHSLQLVAVDVLAIELRRLDGKALPPVEAGAHIDLQLPNGMVRSYSLCNEPGEDRFYVVAVLRDRVSRGGSRCVHEALQVGDIIHIAGPRNHFRLDESAEHSVLVAGGIGVTPILCMARRLRQLGRSAEILYFSRSHQTAAYVAELRALGFPLHLHIDEEMGGPPDLRVLLEGRVSRPGTHLYACGPAVMLDAFVATCEHLGMLDYHIERFAAQPVPDKRCERRAYSVELRRSGRRVEVRPGQTLLRALLDEGVKVDHACEEGICGACRTAVLEGEPDHRDSVLTSHERDSNHVIMPCVSGCRSSRLVLDL